jgi:hypothetical protein
MVMKTVIKDAAFGSEIKIGATNPKAWGQFYPI